MTKKIIIFNILLLLAVWGAFETYCYKYFIGKLVVPHHKVFQTGYKDYVAIPVAYRTPDENIEYKKPSRLVLGCSYTFGERLPFERNISSRLIQDT